MIASKCNNVHNCTQYIFRYFLHTTINQYDLTIPAKTDNFPLSATVFEPSDQNATRISAVLSSATGVKRQFYSHFAQYLSEQHQIRTICYDYRGIGRSTPPKGTEWNLIDWIQKDCAGVLEYTLQKYPQDQLVTIGHSVGAHVHAMMYPELNKQVQRVLSVAGSNAYLLWRKKLNLTFLMTLLMFYVLREPLIYFYDYFPTKQLFNVMEDLPKNVVRQWAYFMRRQKYFVDKNDVPLFPEGYESLQCPLLAISFENDEYSTKRSFHEPFVNCQLIQRHYTRQYQFGHLKFFSSKASKSRLWQECAEFLKTGQIPPMEERKE
ncbi:unnamed protein product [Didymodactylos carnosus]|uniref:AB hydrolase-1 domain-containing protein n=2 Tax=Didymodactylos carnosus TaxID=1234261 RepID=A0A815CM72_9BILA|nr:unnamed protein product [Didymodactylos carnosus]CAF4093479.1 unnamed protein product [Didymodactylos carnosus]